MSCSWFEVGVDPFFCSLFYLLKKTKKKKEKEKKTARSLLHYNHEGFGGVKNPGAHLCQVMTWQPWA